MGKIIYLHTRRNIFMKSCFIFVVNLSHTYGVSNATLGALPI